jgi:hypothetical protein
MRPDPEPYTGIQIQGFDDQKFEKICSGNFFNFLNQKLQIPYPYASIKDVKATGDVLMPHP